MAGINKVILVGHLGKDPEVRHLEGGTAVCNFPMATSESYTDRNSGERKTQTEWHNIVLWRRQAETAEKYLRKGSLIYLEGKLRTRSWEDQSGQKKYTTEIVGDTFQMLDRPPSGSRSSDDASPKAESQSTVATEADDLPF